MENCTGIRDSFSQNIIDIFSCIAVVNDYREIVALCNFKLGNKKFNLTSFVTKLLVVVETCFTNSYNIWIREIGFDFVKLIWTWICYF